MRKLAEWEDKKEGRVEIEQVENDSGSTTEYKSVLLTKEFGKRMQNSKILGQRYLLKIFISKI